MDRDLAFTPHSLPSDSDPAGSVEVGKEFG